MLLHQDRRVAEVGLSSLGPGLLALREEGRDGDGGEDADDDDDHEELDEGEAALVLLGGLAQTSQHGVLQDGMQCDG